MFAKTWLLLFFAVAVALHAAALPLAAQQDLVARAPTPCSSLKQRPNWNTLSQAQKSSYFDAVKCLKTKPAVTGIESSKNLYDDFPAIHVEQNHHIHSVAAFLPWHRRFVQARERALAACGYDGPTPYWDWTEAADTGNPDVDPIFSVTDGFGGNGNPNNNDVVEEGPFANFPVDILQGDKDVALFSPHLLRRAFNPDPQLVNAFNSSSVAKAQAFETFNKYRYYLEGTPHGAVHQYIAGDMGPAHSPNEAVFFLHHAQIDRLWSLWQEMDPEQRKSDYAGNLPDGNTLTGPFDASINDTLPTFGNLIDQVQVRDVMDTKSGDLCYVYV
ncbi:Tyrosinase [Kalmanozyma brasiliensis GHG001]|uniref:Tyrosinase copper-binding domain-containing protein n=1 Tax=Kalmanozyma brasiliensis (strain GHG001) TaxID=1365824 RepID=V5F1K6_KALBG|nr:Tyrosinase [Kalmanozyma brasiliensis GHG001]EST09179.1 Tyrosinase [Kalmanozyma brasiliensis GHG001]